MSWKDAVPQGHESRCFWNLTLHFLLGLTTILVLFAAPVPSRLYVATKIFLGALAAISAAYGMTINIVSLGEVYDRHHGAFRHERQAGPLVVFEEHEDGVRAGRQVVLLLHPEDTHTLRQAERRRERRLGDAEDALVLGAGHQL